jgi:hypothetical protein
MTDEEEMTEEEELIDKIIGLFAFDSGATDSGIKDDTLKKTLRERDDIESLLQAAVISLDPDQGYTIEDTKEFLDWVEDEHGLGVDWL